MVFPPLILFLRVFWHYLRIPKVMVFPCLLLIFIGSVIFAKIQAMPQFKLVKYSMFTSLIYAAVLILLGIAVVRSSSSRILFTLLVCHNYADVVVLFSRQFYLYVKNPADLYMDSKMVYSMLVAVLLTFPFLWLIADRQIRPMMEMERNMPCWKYLWSIPASYLIIYRQCIYPEAFGEGMAAKPDLLLPIAWTVGTFVTYFLVLRMLHQTRETVRLEEQLRHTNEQVVLQQEQYTLIRDHVEEAYRVRHDLRHHLHVMKGYLVGGDFDGIVKYIDQLLMSRSLEEVEDCCENRAGSALISHYMGIAKQYDIHMRMVVDIPAKSFVSDQDLCVIVGNLLENAVEACIRQTQGSRFIDVKAAFQSEGTFVLTVQNSHGNQVVEEDGVFYSSKRQGRGRGVESVRNVVQRYGGVAKFESQGGVFSASVLLNAVKSTIR